MIAVEEQLIYAGSHGTAFISGAELGEAARRLCSDGRRAPWDPQQVDPKKGMAC